MSGRGGKVLNIAYIILAHKKPSHLKRMVARLNTEGASFFIHIDKKTDESTYEKFVEEISANNIHFTKRHTCYWGDSSIVEATLACMKEIKSRGVVYNYAILLSGEDYPIMSTDKIEQALDESNNCSLIHFNEMPYMSWNKGGMYRFQNWHFRAVNYKKTWVSYIIHKGWVAISSLFPIKRNIPLDYKPYGGSQWWCISKECLEYIVEFTRSNQKFNDFFRNVFIPDEMFFQTVILNSPFRHKVINENYRYIDWSTKSAYGSPALLNEGDLDRIMKSGKWFARKFGDDSKILDKIDVEIG